MREATFAGYFYPESETKLRAAIEEAFTGERGPGSMPQRKKIDRAVTAAILPHAGYAYSGACAAWGYHALAASPKPDLYIILGPNHDGMESGTSMETWKTPLGMIRADQEFVRELVKKGSIRLNDQIFQREHSIEVHLPFLQTIDEQAKIAPLMVSDETDIKALALDIKETLVEQGKKAVIIASSDFTHHGPDYHYVRFTQQAQEQIAAFDKRMIDLILAKNGKEFFALVEQELATVCGAKPITLLLELLTKEKGRLEQYYTSAELSKDGKNSVSYACILFEKA